MQMIITQWQYEALKSVTFGKNIDFSEHEKEYDYLIENDLLRAIPTLGLFDPDIFRYETSPTTAAAIEEYERYLQSVERDEKNIRISEHSDKHSTVANIVAWISLGISGLTAVITTIIEIIRISKGQ